eukprot:CAMPEP_0172869090 /NCGR_PEP_ID=MMETSP1075-20121228/88030_1 /TAXON_ID=2916 /ORGANISM="Ceratium fusus, Strain PA161109" /LENGTH=487 /DNA_ID=CAMNT_0013718899 /DNA_START=50 /DNA_END=1513 /DNA_ORIENTATION=+
MAGRGSRCHFAEGGTYSGGSGTSSVCGSVQQELGDAEGMYRSKSDYSLQRGKSKKEIKTEKTTKFYKDLTNALHNKVADFMVGVSTEDDDDEQLEELRRDLNTTIKALQEALLTEVQQRERTEKAMREQFERQEARFDALRVTQDRLSEMQSVVGKVNERIQYLENGFGSNVEKLSRDVEVLKSSNLVANVEKLNSADRMQAAKIQELERHCSDLVDHVHHIMEGHGQLENKLDSSFRNYSAEMDKKHSQHTAKHAEHIENLSNVQRDLTRIGAEVEDRHANLVKTLEESINEALSKTHVMIVAANKEGADTAKDLAALRAEVDGQHRNAVDGLAPQIDEVRTNLNSLQQEFVTVRERDARSMQAALDREATAGERFRAAAQDCFDRMDKRFTSLDETCSGHAQELRTLAESSAEVCEGLNKMKSSMGQLASTTASELQTSRDEIDQICISLSNVSKSWSSNVWSRPPSRTTVSSESRTMQVRTGGA